MTYEEAIHKALGEKSVHLGSANPSANRPSPTTTDSMAKLEKAETGSGPGDSAHGGKEAFAPLGV